MSPGSKWEIFIPSGLAYGDRRVYQIGPNSALIFEVELLSVAKNVGAKATPDGKTPTGTGIESQLSGLKPSADISPDTQTAK
jgi:hypothetical protein